MRNYRRLTYKDRLQLESLYNSKKFSIRAIASLLGFAPSTICEELKHGYYNKRNHDWTETKRYSADRGQQHADFSITTKRPQLKIGNDYNFVNLVETLIIDQKKSPDEVAHLLRTEYKTKDKNKGLHHNIIQLYRTRLIPSHYRKEPFLRRKAQNKKEKHSNRKKSPSRSKHRHSPGGNKQP